VGSGCTKSSARFFAQLDKPDEIVIPFEHAVLVIDYPLSTPATIPISAPLPIGFTRAALVKTICEEYGHVYDAEEGTAATKTIPREERGELRNRNRTDGAYGIWGHDLQDLVLTAARWTRRTDGTVADRAPRRELNMIPWVDSQLVWGGCASRVDQVVS